MMFTKLNSKNEPVGSITNGAKIASFIACPSEEVKKGIYCLRQNSDEIQHRITKGRLPAFSCGKYKHDYVCDKNWESSDTIGFDLDHMSQDCIQKAKARLVSMPGIFMVFRSPSGTGLKVFFHLETTIKFADEFRYLYKWIHANIFKGYDKVDTKAFSVSRLCFVSHDPEIYHDAFKEKLNLDEFYKDYRIQVQETLAEMKRKEAEKIAKREVEKVAAVPVERRVDAYMQKVVNPYNINRRGDRRGTNKKIYGFYVGLTEIMGNKELARDQLLSIATDYESIRDIRNMK